MTSLRQSLRDLLVVKSSVWMLVLFFGPRWTRSGGTLFHLARANPRAPLQASVLRLRGGFEELSAEYLDRWDGTRDGCKCLINCRCAHCDEFSGMKKLLETNYLGPQPTICGTETDRTVAIPSWPPADNLPRVSVPGDWPNVSWAMYAPIGATEESLAKERALANGFMHEEKERARTVVAGGQEDGGEAPYFTAHPTTEPSDCSDESSVEAVGGCSPGLVTFNPDHAESRRVHVDSGRFAWECNKNDSLGHWIKISDRTVHVSGTVGYEERKGGGGGESDRGTGEDVEMQNVGTVGRRRKVLETALVGGWMLCDGSAGSLFHLVLRKERGGPVVIMAGGNWSMVECCVRVRPGPHRPGHYPKAAAWLGGHAVYADRRAELAVSRCSFGILPHRVKLADYFGIGAESHARVTVQDSHFSGFLRGAYAGENATLSLLRCTLNQNKAEPFPACPAPACCT